MNPTDRPNERSLLKLIGQLGPNPNQLTETNRRTNQTQTTVTKRHNFKLLTQLSKSSSPKCVPTNLQDLRLSSVHDTRLINQLHGHTQFESSQPYSQNVDTESYRKPAPTSKNRQTYFSKSHFNIKLLHTRRFFPYYSIKILHAFLSPITSQPLL